MFTRLRYLFTRAIPTSADTQPTYAFGSIFSHAGTFVNPDTAMRCAAVYACVRVLAESVASLPLHLYQRLDTGGKSRASSHPLYRLLHDEPNPEQTSYEWRESTVTHLLLHGNAYSEIERNGAGRPIALWLLNPANMTVQRTAGELLYTYRQSGTTYKLAPSQVLHIRALSVNGITGLSPIAQTAEAIGLGQAAEEFEARFFSNGAATGKVLEIPGRVADEKKKAIVESFRSAYSGLSKAHRLAVLDEGMRLIDSGVPPKDAQFLELRQFQLAEIARIFRVPPHMIGDLSRSTNNNIEHQSLEFVMHTLRPWLVRIEQAINRALLTEAERALYFAEFAIDGLLRGDIKSRYEAYAIGRQNGWLCADEIREFENLNPLPDGKGKVYLTPLNMAAVNEPAPEKKEPAKRDVSAPETRDDDSDFENAKARHQIQKSFVPVLEDAIARVVRREVNDVGRLVKKHLGQRDAASLQDALEQFYAEHAEFIAKNMRASVTALADAIAEQLETELSTSLMDKPEYREFIESFISRQATRFSSSSSGQLAAIIRDTQAEGGDVAEAIDERLEEWTEKRPAKDGRNEATRIGGAITRLMFGLSGAERVVWRNVGDACPICRQLDGRTVGIDEPFASPGDVIGDLIVDRKTLHPPLHSHCACVLARG